MMTIPKVTSAASKANQAPLGGASKAIKDPRKDAPQPSQADLLIAAALHSKLMKDQVGGN